MATQHQVDRANDRADVWLKEVKELRGQVNLLRNVLGPILQEATDFNGLVGPTNRKFARAAMVRTEPK